MRNFPCSLVILVLLAQASHAKPLTYVLPEETATLRPGPDMETAQNNCMSCHSVDYINTQPPGRGSEFWEAEVKKMIKSYHAPISEADAKTITDYLAKTY
jgi:mono/diheme cytochrome c family protein